MSDTGERIASCLDELGIDRAHFVGGWSAGCADASLYERFEAAGIEDVESLPTRGTERPPTWWLTIAVARARLSMSDAVLFDRALETGARERTAFVSEPFHLAVGTKPKP